MPPLLLPPAALDLVAARFRVLGEPARLALLQRLHAAGESSVTQLAAALGTTQPNASKHLRVLQEAGFVARRQERNTVYYSLADEHVPALCDLVCSGLERRLRTQARALAPRRRP